MATKGHLLTASPTRVRVTDTVASAWLRGLRDHRAYLVPVGCTWRLSFAPLGHRWRLWVAVRPALTWQATEEDFRRAVALKAGRYYFEAVPPGARRYHDCGLAYVDVAPRATDAAPEVPPARALSPTVLAALRARQPE